MIVLFQFISIFLTTGVEMVICLELFARLRKLSKHTWKIIVFSLVGALIITAVHLITLSEFYYITVKCIVLIFILLYLFREEIRLSVLFIYCYEISISLWEFILTVLLRIILHSEYYTLNTSKEYLYSIWIVRLFLILITFTLLHIKEKKTNSSFKYIAMIMLLGMFGVIAISSQHIIPVNDDQLTTWIILSVCTLMAIQYYNMNRQYEMEKKIANLKADQAEILERDYKTLHKIYSNDAKLYHDLHNHVEVMYHYLSDGHTAEATKYLECLREPIKKMTLEMWTGDEAIDYLIISKLAIATQVGVKVRTNIEYPKNTNIRSTDMVAILGNLLDNAIEATQNASEDLRFIRLTIRRINEMLIIKVENGCETVPKIKDGNIQTSKPDKNMHGWGLKSVQAAVEHYDGVIETLYDKNIFWVVTTLYYHKM